MFILTNIPYKKFHLFYGIYFLNHLNEGGGLQPSQPVLWSGYGDFQRKRKSHGVHIWLLSTSPMAKMAWPTHLSNILHLERSYLVQRDFQAELGLDFGWAMVSWFASGMMFGRATLLRDACHNLYQFTRFSWPQSDRLHSIWRRKKDFSPYSTAHPRAFGFLRLFFYGLHKYYLPAQKKISFGSSILTVIIMYANSA